MPDKKKWVVSLETGRGKHKKRDKMYVSAKTEKGARVTAREFCSPEFKNGIFSARLATPADLGCTPRTWRSPLELLREELAGKA